MASFGWTGCNSKSMFKRWLFPRRLTGEHFRLHLLRRWSELKDCHEVSSCCSIKRSNSPLFTSLPFPSTPEAPRMPTWRVPVSISRTTTVSFKMIFSITKFCKPVSALLSEVPLMSKAIGVCGRSLMSAPHREVLVSSSGTCGVFSLMSTLPPEVPVRSRRAGTCGLRQATVLGLALCISLKLRSLLNLLTLGFLMMSRKEEVIWVMVFRRLKFCILSRAPPWIPRMSSRYQKLIPV
mmetsp:Transcript_134330/g.251380  ORF Transcript_134330/g.251380 Transcript_134330/m.251380 type:complete len:237 (+) Transcript_134330:1590-2300(+)